MFQVLLWKLILKPLQSGHHYTPGDRLFSHHGAAPGPSCQNAAASNDPEQGPQYNHIRSDQPNKPVLGEWLPKAGDAQKSQEYAKTELFSKLTNQLQTPCGSNKFLERLSHNDSEMHSINPIKRDWRIRMLGIWIRLAVEKVLLCRPAMAGFQRAASAPLPHESPWANALGAAGLSRGRAVPRRQANHHAANQAGLLPQAQQPSAGAHLCGGSAITCYSFWCL